MGSVSSKKVAVSDSTYTLFSSEEQFLLRTLPVELITITSWLLHIIYLVFTPQMCIIPTRKKVINQQKPNAIMASSTRNAKFFSESLVLCFLWTVQSRFPLQRKVSLPFLLHFKHWHRKPWVSATHPLLLPILLAQLLLKSRWASGLLRLMTALFSKNEPKSHQFHPFSFPPDPVSTVLPGCCVWDLRLFPNLLLSSS